MAKSREIKGRMKAVGNIQRITKTMQMIATARFQASQRRAIEAKPFTHKIAELVGELAHAGLDGQAAVDHPLLRSPGPKADRQLLLVLTSNRGLCGGYNANVLRTTMSFLREQEGQSIDIDVVGKKGAAYFKFGQIPIATFHSQFGDTPSYEDAQCLAQNYIRAFTDGQYDAVHVAYMAFESVSRQSPQVFQLLPLSDTTLSGDQPTMGRASAKPNAPVEYEFSPGPEELLNELLPLTVKTKLFQCFNEAVVGEHVSRMVAMKTATDNAGKMRKSLHRSFNRARQTAITTELSEIISGSAALE